MTTDARARLPLLAVLGILAAVTACSTSQTPAGPPARLAAPPPRPQLMFVSVASDDTFHKVEIASSGLPGGGTFLTNLTCERVYFGGHRGICLNASAGEASTTWAADIFDERFEILHRLPLTGAPSRVRVSSDGRLAAATVFESGHSYSDHGFSTRTTVFDLTSGTSLGDLEQFETRRDARAFEAADFNFWGVTFSRDNDTFYATLDTAGVSYLVKGSVRARTMEVVHAGVECPSLSPDNSRIAHKKRIGSRSRGWWQLAVLELATLQETIVTREARSVDDQVEWFDNDRVIYHLASGSTGADLWVAAVDGSSAPVRMRAAAYSPAVVRAP